LSDGNFQTTIYVQTKSNFLPATTFKIEDVIKLFVSKVIGKEKNTHGKINNIILLKFKKFKKCLLTSVYNSYSNIIVQNI